MSTSTPVTPTPSVALQNFLSLLRALGTLAGSYFVGHAIFGHTVSADALQVVGGAILTIATTAWGIATKTSNIEGIESSIRSVVAALGGLGVSAAIISAQQLAAFLALIIPLATVAQSMLSKAKNQQIANGTVTPTTTGKATTTVPATPPSLSSVTKS